MTTIATDPRASRAMRLCDARRVLVCLRWGIGDLILESSLFPDLRALLPRARLTLLGARPAIDLLAGAPFADEVADLARFGLRHWGDDGNAATAPALADWIAAGEFDAALDVLVAPPPVREAIWSAGIASFECDERAVLESVARGAPASFALRAGAAVGWGLPLAPAPRPALPLPPVPEDDLEPDPLAELEPRGVRPIGIVPGASHGLKRWPAERFAALCRCMLADGAGPLVVFSSPDDDAGRRVAEIAGLRLVPALPLRRVAALLRRCRLVVTCDTGMMHAAWGLGVPVAAVFGPTSARLYLPGGPWDRAAQASLPCEHRRSDRLFPPKCSGEDLCDLGLRSCIDEVGVGELLAAVRSVPTYAIPVPAGEER